MITTPQAQQQGGSPLGSLSCSPSSETPETDGAETKRRDPDVNVFYGTAPSHVARKLERERNRLKAALEDIASGAACLPGYSIAEAAQAAREALSENDQALPPA